MILFIGTSSLWEWVQSIIKDFGTKAVVEFLLFPAAVGLVFWLRPYWKRLIGDGAAKRLARLRSAVQAGNGLWLTEPIKQPDTYELLLKSSIPIITLANLKGGVGKSTITANLAGYFAERSERVLVIDLDFQGSLGAWFRRAARVRTYWRVAGIGRGGL